MYLEGSRFSGSSGLTSPGYSGNVSPSGGAVTTEYTEITFPQIAVRRYPQNGSAVRGCQLWELKEGNRLTGRFLLVGESDRSSDADGVIAFIRDHVPLLTENGYSAAEINALSHDGINFNNLKDVEFPLSARDINDKFTKLTPVSSVDHAASCRSIAGATLVEGNDLSFDQFIFHLSYLNLVLGTLRDFVDTKLALKPAEVNSERMVGGIYSLFGSGKMQDILQEVDRINLARQGSDPREIKSFLGMFLKQIDESLKNLALFRNVLKADDISNRYSLLDPDPKNPVTTSNDDLKPTEKISFQMEKKKISPQCLDSFREIFNQGNHLMGTLKLMLGEELTGYESELLLAKGIGYSEQEAIDAFKDIEIHRAFRPVGGRLDIMISIISSHYPYSNEFVLNSLYVELLPNYELIRKLGIVC